MERPKKVKLQLSNVETATKGRKNLKNPYPEIFTSTKAYHFFEDLRLELVNPKQKLASFSFIFRQMQKDGNIHDNLREKEFRNWLSKHYMVTLDKLKTLPYLSTKNRITIYLLLKEKHFKKP